MVRSGLLALRDWEELTLWLLWLVMGEAEAEDRGRCCCWYTLEAVYCGELPLPRRTCRLGRRELLSGFFGDESPD